MIDDLKTDATPLLTGMSLQWSHLFLPYEENFIQYRAVTNLTLTMTEQDTTTPFITLPMVFPNGNARQFTIPRYQLNDGTYYEFRLGYPFSTYTFYTNTMIAKTFDVNSPFVNSVVSSSLDTIISMSWGQPEYNTDLIGYSVSIYYKYLHNAGVANPTWRPSDSTLVTSFQLPLTQLSFTYGCIDLSAGDCLTPFTTYLVDIAVIRTTGQDNPKGVYVSTQHTVASLHNTSSIYLYALKITMNFTVNVPTYTTGTPINETFLHPLNLHTTQIADLNINLTESTVQSVSDTSIVITMSLAEYEQMAFSTIYNADFVFTPFLIQYGPKSIVEPCSVYCLLWITFMTMLNMIDDVV